MVKKRKQKHEKIAFKPKEVDKKIVNILMNNGRATLKSISKKVGLSIDAVKDHIDKMKNLGIIKRFTIVVNTTPFDQPVSTHVYIKFKNVSEKSINEFLSYLKKHPKIPTVISVLGTYDIFIVLMGRDVMDLEEQKIRLKQKFKDLIDNWEEAVTSKVHKLEHYKF